jgi:hypothetical protein
VISSVVSRFDAVMIERALGFRLLRGLQVAQSLGLSVREAAGSGPHIVRLTLGALAGDAEVNQFGHDASTVVPEYRAIAKRLYGPRS